MIMIVKLFKENIDLILKDGKTSFTPIITKDQDSEIQSRIEIDKAIKDGQINLDVEKDTTDNSLTN